MTSGIPSPDLSRPGIDPDLQHLVVLFGLSVRAFNVCEAAGLLRLSDIRDFVVRHGSFGKLRNCGHKTQLELEDFLKRSSGVGYAEERSEEVVAPEVIVDPEQLRRTFSAHFVKLSTRSRNVLLEHAGSTEPDAVIRFFMQQGRKMPKLPGAGTTVMHELRAMREELLNGLARHAVVRGSSPQELTEEQLWAERHHVEADLVAVLFDEREGVMLLRFLDQYLTREWRGRSVSVYMACLKGKKGTGTLEEIARVVGLTRERVRQILKKLDREIHPVLALVADLPGVAERYSRMVTDKPWLFIDHDLVSYHNEGEDTEWSPLFFAYLARLLNDQRLLLVKWTDLFDRSDASRTLDRERLLLMDQTLAADMHKATQRASEIFERKRRVEEQFPFTSFFEGCDQSQALQDAFREVLSSRFPDIRFEADHVVFTANAKRNQEALLEEVLAALNEPSHVLRIQEEWTKRFPDDLITVGGIRSVAIREKDLFFSIGRTSTYGLRRWEEERPEVKGGTIRSIIAELLEPADFPLHVEQLVEEVRKYRPTTNVTSVRLNLQLDASGQFVLLPGGFVGLSAKHYERIPDPPARVPGSLMRNSVLASFVDQHRSKLAEFFGERSSADPQRIERVINGAIEEGRIQVDEEGVIRSIMSTPEEASENYGELPFDW